MTDGAETSPRRASPARLRPDARRRHHYLSPPRRAPRAAGPRFEEEVIRAPDELLPLTLDNVETILDELRPYLMSDGGNVRIAGIEGPVVKLELEGACGADELGAAVAREVDEWLRLQRRRHACLEREHALAQETAEARGVDLAAFYAALSAADATGAAAPSWPPMAATQRLNLPSILCWTI